MDTPPPCFCRALSPNPLLPPTADAPVAASKAARVKPTGPSQCAASTRPRSPAWRRRAAVTGSIVRTKRAGSVSDGPLPWRRRSPLPGAVPGYEQGQPPPPPSCCAQRQAGVRRGVTEGVEKLQTHVGNRRGGRRPPPRAAGEQRHFQGSRDTGGGCPLQARLPQPRVGAPSRILGPGSGLVNGEGPEEFTPSRVNCVSGLYGRGRAFPARPEAGQWRRRRGVD
mmetsp:Transcript_75780/g.202901  ORF Transcript_75780/g.202901 Transcript_75780/m.202901 type:complete len:224 (+) Transcript_75780:2889-3560(+)